MEIKLIIRFQAEKNGGLNNMKLKGGRRNGRELPREKGGEVIFSYCFLDGRPPPAWAVFA